MWIFLSKNNTYIFSILLGLRREIQCVCALWIIFVALGIFGMLFPDDIYFGVVSMWLGIHHSVCVSDRLILCATDILLFLRIAGIPFK